MSSHQIIPTLDISKFTSGTDEDSRAIAKEVNRACEEIGFLVIEGHGVPDAVIQKINDSCRQFFDLPSEIKIKYRESDDNYFGYKGLKHSALAYSLDDQDAKPDLREVFASGRPDYENLTGEYFQCEKGKAYAVPIRWPEEIAGFERAWKNYYDEMSRLGEKIMRIFAVALNMPVNYFDNMLDKHVSNVGVYNYPEQKEAPEQGQLRGGEHTDFGSLTIVYADWKASGGLEVLTKNKEWMRVPAKPGTFAINIGDMMERWTNDRWVSTLHRVANPSPEHTTSSRRQSVVYFHIPNYDTLVECIPSCTDNDNPPKYEPITVSNHHLMKMGKMYDVD